ncbi:MAG: thiolase family protein [bacterium]
MPEKVAIVGWGQSRFEGDKKDIHLGELIYETVRQALADTGLEIGDIDTVIGASCDVVDGRSISNVFTAEAMGAFLKEESKVEEDGAYAALYAYMRLLTGPFQTAMVVSHGKISESSPQTYSGLICDPFLLRPLGIEAITSSALQACSYMTKYGITEEQAAKVAVKNRKNGLKNLNAQIKKEITVADVMSSPVLASPIKKYDASPITDGCAVAILATKKRAKKITDTPVWIKGVGYDQGLYYPGYSPLHKLESCEIAAKKAYKAAKIKNPTEEIDCAEVYEPFSFYELMLYEALGLCGEGEGGKLIDEGTTEFGGSLPVNTSGGAMCANPIMSTGLVRVIETAMQLSGKAGEHQLKNKPKTALAHSTSGLCMQSSIVYVLGV